MLNCVHLIGNLTRAPEVFDVGNDIKLVMRIAMNEKYLDRNGQQAEHVEYIDVVVWGKRAEGLEKCQLEKGQMVYVEGSLRTNSWDKDGNKFQRTEIRARDVKLLKRPNGQQQPQRSQQPQQPQQPQQQRRQRPQRSGAGSAPAAGRQSDWD